MWKDKMRILRDYIIKHSKIAFPIIIIAAVAVTVAVGLNAGNADAKAGEEGAESTQASEPAAESQEQALKRVVPDVPLELNENADIYSLIATYYNACANGDVDTIQTISNYVEDVEAIRIRELSKYIESYPLIEIYTKPGPEENSYIAYVYTKLTFYGYEEQMPGLQTFYICTDENGKLYLNEGDVSEDILEYINTVNFQDDVIELNNRVTVEYNELNINNPKVFEYITELNQQVSKATGEALAAQNAESAAPSEDGQPEEGGDAAGVGTGEVPEEGNDTPPADTPSEDQPADAGPVSATATTTVNVRSSDSEQADKLGKIAGGTQVEVTEQRPNGWSKIVYEGHDGYVKSEFLQVSDAPAGQPEQQPTEGGASIGSVTATTNINIRQSASETSEKLGVLVGGDSATLLSQENGWCKIEYNGLTGYVKADYVQ